MGRTGYGIDNMIIDELKNGEKTGKELEIAIVNKVRKVTEQKYEDVRKNFYYALNKLLENKNDKQLDIIGYKSIESINHSFKPDGIIFNLVKLEETEINSLLVEMESSESKKAKVAKKKIEKIFEKRYKEYEKNELKFYNSLLNRVKSYHALNLRNELMDNKAKEAQEYYEANKEIYKEYLSSRAKSGKEWRFVLEDPNAKPPKLHHDFIGYNKAYAAIHTKFGFITEKSKLWTIPDLSQEEAHKLMINKYSKKVNPYDKTIWEMKEEDLIDRGRELWLSYAEWLDKEGKSKEDYLKQFGIIQELSRENISKLFDIMLFFINTHKNYESLKHQFSFALSDEEGSMSWFETFIKYVYAEPFYLKFQTDLGIKEPKNII